MAVIRDIAIAPISSSRGVVLCFKGATKAFDVISLTTTPLVVFYRMKIHVP